MMTVLYGIGTILSFRIQKLEVNQNSLQLTMDRIFQYKQDEERSYSGVI